MRNVRKARWGGMVVALVATASLLAGCAGTESGSSGERAGWIDGAPVRREDIPTTTGGDMDTAMLAAGSTAEKAVSPDAPVSSTQASSALRAGSVDDNEKWEDYLLYRQEFLRTGVEVHDVDVSGRRIVTVKDKDGHPLLGATVRLFSGDTVLAEGKTHADGRTFLFPKSTDLGGGGGQQQTASTLRIVAEHAGTQAETPVTGATDVTLTLDATRAAGKVALDIMFVIDATGSMGDEIEQLKANIISISDQLAKLPTKPDVRFATTVYRDRGDAFVTRTFDFTSDVGAFQTALKAIEADGGGDLPESVNAGLYDAIHKPAWRGGDTVSLAFLVGDAAPHLDYSNDADYAVEVFEAAKRGIKIEPIASSGLDEQGEYIFRQLAQLTGGRFSFLTYGAAGAPEPGDTTTNHVKDYSVLSLDDLVVRLVGDELAPLAT
jgi:Mg-chelatase subunit ChlD